ncbi:hypothetical protein [Hymenobacter volaticus]|uniref:Uncharacterized protein n=1 Tax=Hymenobacter volaticus TaxID=2932254 RepID=A0ABY4G209_9BACT|nr:hypothetical protein [Hymenobacter volaticus]UOQ64863.1 hypothetical protein MUN86_14970 [Hymenobacter volaticus]
MASLPSPNTFSDVLQRYQPQVAQINEQGHELLREAQELLSYFESMPEHLTHRQSHDAANELRAPKGIIAVLESSFEDVFKSFTADLPSVYDEGMDIALAEYKFEECIRTASAIVATYRTQLDTLPQ